ERLDQVRSGILGEESGWNFFLVSPVVRELSDEPALIFFVLQTDVLDELVVSDEGGVELQSERPHVRLRIVVRDLHLQMAEIRTPESLGDAERLRVGLADEVEPAPV